MHVVTFINTNKSSELDILVVSVRFDMCNYSHHLTPPLPF